MPVHGRHQAAGEKDKRGGAPGQVEEGDQVELKCDPGGSCLKRGCQWTLPGNIHISLVPRKHIYISSVLRCLNGQAVRHVIWRRTAGPPMPVLFATIQTLGGTFTTGGRKTTSNCSCRELQNSCSFGHLLCFSRGSACSILLLSATKAKHAGM